MDTQNVLVWLRSGDTLAGPSGNFKKLDRFLPGVEGQSDYDRAQDIENVLDWLHGYGVDVDGFADPAGFLPLFESVGSIPFSGRTIPGRE